MSRDQLLKKICFWIVLGLVLVLPVSYFEGGDGGDWDGIGGGGSFGEIGYPYRWKYTRNDNWEYSVRYDYVNYLINGLILSLVSPFLLEPILFLSRKLKLREKASLHYSNRGSYR